jgi:hypothetical protein
VWYGVDMLTDKYPNVGGMVYCHNNPIRLIDPNGMDVYCFDENGNYTTKITDKGQHAGVIAAEKGKTAIKFKFADPINDPKLIDDKNITKAVLVSNESIKEALSNSGVFDENNQDNRYEYIKKESNASNLAGEGKMDYTVKADFSINGNKQEGLPHNTLYVSKTKSGYIGHNNYNFGNFLWGAGASALGFWKMTARLGAHWNNFLNDTKNVGKPWYKRSFDSKDDQKSISFGFEWMKENRKK